MKEIFNWLTESHRWKHLLAGCAITATTAALAIVVCNFVCAALAALWTTCVTAVAVEYKDKLWGGKFDWLDVLATVLPAIVLLIISLFV